MLVELNENIAGNDAVASYNQPGARKINEFVDLFVALMQGSRTVDSAVRRARDRRLFGAFVVIRSQL